MFKKEKEPALDQRMVQIRQYTQKSYGRFGVGWAKQLQIFFAVKWSLFDELHMIATFTITKWSTDMQE